MQPTPHPHHSQPIYTTGTPLQNAAAAMILVHGRGASAQSILSLTREILAENVAYLAPQASGNTWYPHSFLAPLASNEPYLSSALATLDELIAQITDAGIPASCIMLLGFSQGACLILEYAARHPQRFGALIGLSGGLIGPPGTPRTYSGSLDGTPVFLGCSDVDPHIPLARVHETTAVLTSLGALVDERIYPGMGHTVNQDELAAIRDLQAEVVRRAAAREPGQPGAS